MLQQNVAIAASLSSASIAELDLPVFLLSLIEPQLHLQYLLVADDFVRCDPVDE